jgi:hypothetical protein
MAKMQWRQPLRKWPDSAGLRADFGELHATIHPQTAEAGPSEDITAVVGPSVSRDDTSRSFHASVLAAAPVV